MLHLHNLTGSQVGAYFGHSIAVLDANGDGLDDIAIGAPLHSSPMDRYETGRVYVVYQNKDHKFRQWTILDGLSVGGRFGLSLAKLGDLDQDGFDDLAIGAPYDQGGGSVFIFRGGPNGIDETPSQLITGQDVDPRLRGFGYSLSGRIDLDGNGYPDLLVGAPDSGQTVYFRYVFLNWNLIDEELLAELMRIINISDPDPWSGLMAMSILK
jgi:integrin alpha 8